jgi:hypothetical protein
MYGYIYIIKLREHINTNESIYKIGKTEDIIRRFKQYPKESKLLYTICTENMDETETILKNQLHSYLRSDLGSEYFECNINIIKNIIDENINFIDKTTNVQLSDNHKKLETVLKDYHIDILVNSPFKKYIKHYLKLIKKNIDYPDYFKELLYTAEYFQNGFQDKSMIKVYKHNIDVVLKRYDIYLI